MEVIRDAWDTLVLGVEPSVRENPRELVERFWPGVVTRLKRLKDVEITGPSGVAWFHLRRTNPAPDRVEILRLRRDALSSQDRETIRVLAESESGVNWAGWCAERFEDHHDNAFLSFLQKLSVLRAVQGITYPRWLGGVSVREYDKCLYCQEAYRIMMSEGEDWYSHLSPWFEYMKSTRMDACRTHEYAHWFGHIISGWRGSGAEGLVSEKRDNGSE